MNILCVDQFFNLGGAQRSLLDLLPAFSERGWRASLTVPGDGPFPELVRKLGIATYVFKEGEYSSGRKTLSQIMAYASRLPHVAAWLCRLIRRLDIDLLYVNGPRVLPPAALAARWAQVPLVFHCHNRLDQSTAIALAGRASRLARARVIACCEHAAGPLRGYVRPKNLSIIYNGVDQVNGSQQRLATGLRRIGVVGRIEAEKGQLEFVKAARIISKAIPDCQYTVIGAPMFSDDMYFKEVVAASTGLPIAFPGWQNDITAAFSHLDLLVVPSKPLEATTRVILEAYSAGIPVVAFPSGGIPEILCDEKTGFLAENGTPEALASRILSVLALGGDRLAAIRKRARECWYANFRLATYREKVCEEVARLLAIREQAA